MNVEKILSQMTLEEKAGLCSGADFWRTKSIERLGVPQVCMCDGPIGLRKQPGEADHLGLYSSIETVSYPTGSALAASFDRDVLHTLGAALGEECQAENIAMLLGPAVNIKRSPLCGRNFEYFSEDPYLAGELSAAYIEALQSSGIAACVKHYAANNQETLRMPGNSVVDERTLREIYLPVFETAVKQGKTRSIMCAYNAVNGTFCAENKTLLTDILREEWGFDGFVVTDWGAVKDRVKGLLAGLDLEMPGDNRAGTKKIVEAVRNGKLDEILLDNAVRNILQFIQGSVENRRPGVTVDRMKNMELAADLEKECAVLLKNDNKVLPLKKSTRIAFIGEFAEKPRYQGGGSSHINVPHPVGALEAARGLNIIYSRGYDVAMTESDAALVDEAVQAAENAGAAVIFAGLPETFETEGIDRKTLAMPENQNALIEAVAAVQPNTVVVLHTGSPIALPWIDKVAAVLCVYLGGANVGTAAAAVLFGAANPSGKLAETWPLKLEDNPSYLNFPGVNGVVEYREGIYAGYRYYDKKSMGVLFPFGYGLSYTSFAYRDLRLDKEKMRDSETLTVTCKVKNTGGSDGKEVVQLYVRDVESAVGRPVRELKGFAKISLKPGEEKEVGFTLDKRAFAYYETKIHDWYVESGSFAVEIGASSRDIRLSAPVEVKSSSELPIVFTGNTPIGELQKTPKGRAVLEQMMTQYKNNEMDISSSMGEGGDNVAVAMMLEMPLGALVSFGRITDEQLNDMIAMLNG
ncbi:MAG: glycoside hydrolase family 3 C-terminal domain-containing protein [Treponema sp.]|jgi:beta-glucosidase|nr:glycoside hydrolase family 3 C-terminal domain-containing protein [Treponema sp.]